jgi:hypothetical protein
MRPLRLLVVALVALLALAGGADARTRVLPGWSLVGTYDLQVPTGYASLDGTWDFTMFGTEGNLRFTYDSKARINALGTYGIGTFVAYSGRWYLDEEKKHRVLLQDSPKNPAIVIDGVVSEDGRSIEGTIPTGQTSEPITFRRLTPPTPPTTFRLRLDTTMNRRGIVRGRPLEGGKEAVARLDTFDGRSFGGGRIRGRVITTETGGPTTAWVRIRGNGWSAFLTGPVDETGFHASVDIRAGGFVVTDALVDLPVGPGPEPPPPPPPPPPKNLVANGVARRDGNHFTITRQKVPERFFGKVSTINVEFETEDSTLPVHATPENFNSAAPRRVYVKVGTRNYGTSNLPGDVLIEVRRFSTTPGETIEVLLTGTIADSLGRTKAVDVLLQGRLAP